MKKKVYAILSDVAYDLGEGYGNASYDELIGLVDCFDYARYLMELYVELRISNTEQYARIIEVIDEDWNFIDLDYGDTYDTGEYIHIEEKLIWSP